MVRAAAYDRDTALDAAMSLFWRKGYHATSLKDLESALSMKPGSIYAAFDSKENLYLLSLERYFETSRSTMMAQMAKAPSAISGLASHFRSYSHLSPEDASRQACMLTKTLIDTQSTDPEIAKITKTYLDLILAEFTKTFQAARDAGELATTADPGRLARRFQANVSALRLEMHRGATQEDIADLAEDMAQEIENLRI